MTQNDKAKAVQSVLAMPGWDIIEFELTEYGQMLINKWKDNSDPSLDIQFKADVRALDRLFKKVKSYAKIKT